MSNLMELKQKFLTLAEEIVREMLERKTYIVRIPQQHNPLCFINEPFVIDVVYCDEACKDYHILTVEEICENEDALNHVFSWGLTQFVFGSTSVYWKESDS